MKEIVESLIHSKIDHLGIYVSDAFRSKEEGKTIFNIELDSQEVIDLDKTDEIEQDYDELDIYSKQKGEIIDE